MRVRASARCFAARAAEASVAEELDVEGVGGDDELPELDDDVPDELDLPDDVGFEVGAAVGFGATFTTGAASGAGSGAGSAARLAGAAVNAPRTPASRSTARNAGTIDATLPNPFSLSMLPVLRVRSSKSPRPGLSV